MKKNYYQLTIHLNPQLKKEEIKEIKEELKEKLEKEKGKIIKTNDLKKTTLTFPIEDFKESFLWDLTVELPPNKISQFQANLKEKDQILRLMISKKPEEEIRKTTFDPSQKESKTETEAEPKPSQTEETQEPEEEIEETEVEEKERKKEKKTETDEKTKQAKASEEPEEKKNEKVELEDIDDKLDDILEDEM